MNVIRMLTATVVALTSCVSLAYDWSGKTGVVTLTETAEVNEADVATVAALTGIVLQGDATDIIFKNTSELTLSGYISGDGRIIKRGTGDLCFKMLKTSSSSFSGRTVWLDHYTKGGIVVETGTLKLPQDSTVSSLYGPLQIDEGATVWVQPKTDTCLKSLNGAGTLMSTNTCRSAANPPPGVFISNYGDAVTSHFTGPIKGWIQLQINGKAILDNPTSDFEGTVAIYRNDSTSDEKRGQLETPTFGTRKSASPLGEGAYYLYAYYDVNLRMGGRVRYTGTGETTDKRFGFEMYYARQDPWIDAGPTGGVTFTGDWGMWNAQGYMAPLILKGSNTCDMVIAGSVSSKDGSGLPMCFRKQGTGTWRFGAYERTGMDSAVFVDEGTLKYDSIADVGVPCALGVATNCYRALRGTGKKTDANKLPYEIQLGSTTAVPTFDYSGSNVWCSTQTRRLGLVGSGARISNNAPGVGRVKLLGGIRPDDSETTDKTIWLCGTNVATASIGNVSDGENCKVSVVKEGSGVWSLERNLAFTGSLDVRAGTLKVVGSQERPYRWYRFTVIQQDGKYDAETDACLSNSYYIRLRRLGLFAEDGTSYVPTMTDVRPAEADEHVNSIYVYPSGYWHQLQPGQVTFGDYTGSSGYISYASNLPGRLFQDTTSVYNLYINSPISEDRAVSSFVPVVFRLPDDAPVIRYYDVVADQSYTATVNGHVARFKLEASTDGYDWVELHKLAECPKPIATHWFSNTNVAWSAGQNCKDVGIGYPIAGSVAESATATSLASVSDIRVASGASLVAEGEVALPRLTLDGSGANGTVMGFTFPATGTVNLVNVPADASFTLPLTTFPGCTGLENLSDWNVSVDGKGRMKYAVSVTEQGVTFSKRGLALIVR